MLKNKCPRCSNFERHLGGSFWKYVVNGRSENMESFIENGTNVQRL